MSTITIKIAEISPKLPISVAITSSFSYNGVVEAYYLLKISSI